MANSAVEQIITIPPAMTGLNVRDALSRMLDTDAIILENWDVDAGGIVPRRGYSEWVTGLGGGGVEFLAEWSGGASSKLIAGANGNIVDATSEGAPSTLASGFGEDRWQSVMFGGRLLMFNGTDAPRDYNGTAIAATAWSGSGLTIANLIQACVYSSRVWAIERDTLKVWYGATGAITGAMTAFDVAQVAAHGGSLLFCTSWTHDTGSGSQEFLVLVIDTGEVLVYQGDPASTFGLTNRFKVGRPLARRAWAKISGDVIVMTVDGWTPLSVLLSTGLQLAQGNISDRIVNQQRQLGALHAGKFGWEALYYPAKGRVLFNAPLAEGVQIVQYVFHLATGAWSAYSAINAHTWTTFQSALFAGMPDGRVLKCDDILSDNGANIRTDIQTAFSDLGYPGRYKQIGAIQPVFLTDSAIGVSLKANVDYQVADPVGVVTSAGGAQFTWESLTSWAIWTAWNTAPAARLSWYGGGAAGYTVGVRMKADVKNINATLIGFDVAFQVGGPM